MGTRGWSFLSVRLYNEHVPGAHVLQDADEDVLVGELEDIRLARGNLQIVADGPRQGGVGVPAKHSQLIHRFSYPFRFCLQAARAVRCSSVSRATVWDAASTSRAPSRSIFIPCRRLN